jgi:hypothetical protein
VIAAGPVIAGPVIAGPVIAGPVIAGPVTVASFFLILDLDDLAFNFMK